MGLAHPQYLPVTFVRRAVRKHRTPSAAGPLPPTAEHGSTASSTTQDRSSQDASRTGNRRSHRLSLADNLHSSHRQRNYRHRGRSHASRTLTAKAILSQRWQRCHQQSHNQHDCRPDAFHNQILLKHGNENLNQKRHDSTLTRQRKSKMGKLRRRSVVCVQWYLCAFGNQGKNFVLKNSLKPCFLST